MLGLGLGRAVRADANCAPSEDDSGLRQSLNYVEVSADPKQTCSQCAFFSPGSDTCGQCQILMGSVHSRGHCDSWSAKG
ncbi:MAG: high-potential iron-sulfur protein [Steroidobacteraceae bacterium]